MHKALLALGLIVLFAGVVLSSWAYSHSVKTWKKIPVKTVTAEWDVEADFQEGDNLYVTFPAPKEGEMIPNGSEGFFFVEIVDPDGLKTNFSVVFQRLVGKEQWLLRNITVTLNEGGLTVDEPLWEVGGTAEKDGSYTARLDETAKYFYGMEPPTYLELYKRVVEEEYPYRGLVFPVGVTLIIAGFPLSVWAAKDSKLGSKSRKRRR